MNPAGFKSFLAADKKLRFRRSVRENGSLGARLMVCPHKRNHNNFLITSHAHNTLNLFVLYIKSLDFFQPFSMEVP
jgi:hypothetical protein